MNVTPLLADRFTVDGWIDSLNPIHWNSHVFLVLILALFSLRVFYPWPNHGAARFAEELMLILPAGLFYFFVRNLIDADPSSAFDNAHRIIAHEERFGLLREPELQAHIIDHPLLINIVNWIYIWGHWPVIIGWVFWMWFRHRDAYPQYRNAVLISGLIGMVIFALFPVAPPRLVSEIDVVDTVTLYSRSYRVLQPPSLTNIYAAMPSLHFGWNLLVGIAIFRSANARAGRVLGLLLPAGMYGAIVLTGNHYVLDGIAGGAVALTGLVAAMLLVPRIGGWLSNTISFPGAGQGFPPKGY